MQNLKAEPPPRVPLVVTGDESGGKVTLGGIDITADLHRLVVDLTGHDCIATIDLAVDVEIDFPVTQVAVVSDKFADLTAKDLDDVLAMCPMGTTLGAHLLEHLQSS